MVLAISTDAPIGSFVYTQLFWFKVILWWICYYMENKLHKF